MRCVSHNQSNFERTLHGERVASSGVEEVFGLGFEFIIVTFAYSPFERSFHGSPRGFSTGLQLLQQAERVRL